MFNFNTNLLNYGWVCPKCGSVYSPTTSLCQHCYRSGNTYSYDKITNLNQTDSQTSLDQLATTTTTKTSFSNIE